MTAKIYNLQDHKAGKVKTAPVKTPVSTPSPSPAPESGSVFLRDKRTLEEKLRERVPDYDKFVRERKPLAQAIAYLLEKAGYSHRECLALVIPLVFEPNTLHFADWRTEVESYFNEHRFLHDILKD